MFKNIITIMKKEFSRFFKDKRMVLSCLILPGAMIFIMYSLMGNVFSSIVNVDESHKYSIYTINAPGFVTTLLDTSEVSYDMQEITAEEVESKKALLQDSKIDLIVIFPVDFERLIAEYNPSLGVAAPNVEMYYNSSKVESQTIFKMLTEILNGYESSISNKFDINNQESPADVAKESDIMGMMMSTMLPFLLIIFLFSGCMSLAPEAIAGEKERGTMATLLVTPIKRSQLAIGKILSLSVLSVLCALSSFLGTIISLPKLMGGVMPGEVSANIYGFGDYVSLLLIIISTVFVIITVLSLVSALANSIKEANTYIMPLMLIVMLIGLSSMFSQDSAISLGLFLVPIYNSVMAMSKIMSFANNAAMVALTVISNIVISGIGVFVLTKVFNNEKIMFSK